jgi:hypothetical protein
LQILQPLPRRFPGHTESPDAPLCDICLENKADLFNTPCGFSGCFSCEEAWCDAAVDKDDEGYEEEVSPRCPKCRGDHQRVYYHQFYRLDASRYPFRGILKQPSNGSFDQSLQQLHRIAQDMVHIAQARMTPENRDTYSDYVEAARPLLELTYTLSHYNLHLSQKPFKHINRRTLHAIHAIRLLTCADFGPIGEALFGQRYADKVREMFDHMHVIFYNIKVAQQVVLEVVRKRHLACF